VPATPYASGGGPDANRNHSSDVGRRVALRREQLGLSRTEVAKRAGIAPEYLRYLEEEAASPTLPSLTRVARALQTTVAGLSGVAASSSPEPPAHRGELEVLDTEECHRLLAGHSVGRLAVSTPEGPAIVPVTYTFTGGVIVFRTQPGATPSHGDGEEVAFEVDQLDEALTVGWSVQVAGPAHLIDEAEALGRLAEKANEPWARGDRNLWLRIDPVRVTGRRLRFG
jgi:transcriptional regulator with XRE-family HTH domain